MSQKLYLSQQESCCCIKLSNAQNVLVQKTLYTVFFNLFFNWNQLPKICQHGRKEGFEITNIAVFQSDLFLVETIAPQSGGILQTSGSIQIATLWRSWKVLSRKSLSLTMYVKATEQYFPVVLFIMMYKVVSTFKSVGAILSCVVVFLYSCFILRC